MATEYSVLRTHLLEYLKNHSSDPHSQLEFGDIRGFFTGKEISLNNDINDWRSVKQIIHEFYIEGIIVPGPKIQKNTAAISGFLDFPSYQLTEYGEKVVNETEYQPYDPDGYLRRIKGEIPQIDDVIIRYLEETLNCFRKNLLLTSAVMLGCAAEKAVLLLIEVFGDSLTNPQNKAVFEKETNTFIIKRKYDALWKRLEPIAKTLPDNMGDNLGTIIDRIFDIIRTTRNDAGHPSGNIIEKETVHANLLLFPIFCKRIYGLIDYF
ncbi:MAG: hypothetical protein KAT56_10075 [Sedimentisphaerales bacterium]|nr:hypothetical protein [Sedimentisphaerales bacterium]